MRDRRSRQFQRSRVQAGSPYPIRGLVFDSVGIPDGDEDQDPSVVIIASAPVTLSLSRSWSVGSRDDRRGDREASGGERAGQAFDIVRWRCVDDRVGSSVGRTAGVADDGCGRSRECLADECLRDVADADHPRASGGAEDLRDQVLIECDRGGVAAGRERGGEWNGGREVRQQCRSCESRSRADRRPSSPWPGRRFFAQRPRRTEG